MLYVAAALFVTVFCLSWLVLEYFLGHKAEIRQRMQDIGVSPHDKMDDGTNEALQQDLRERVFKPMLGSLAMLVQKYTPARTTKFIETRLVYAGRPLDLDASSFIALQYVTAAVVGIAALLVSIFVYHSPLLNQLMALLLGFFAGYFLVDLILRNTVIKRQDQIRQELPDLLDLMTVSIEAGLGFDAAMQKVVMKANGPLADEFKQCLQEIRVGRTRREALKELGQRNGVEDLSRFVDAIVQADQLGVSLGNVLRNQSDQMRVIRRQRIEEQAMKAPIKMLIPMVVFIFPTIFVVVLAPPILSLMENL